jgi:hypothetical protein
MNKRKKNLKINKTFSASKDAIKENKVQLHKMKKAF